MRVETLFGYENPQQAACTCARGDYFDGFVADVEYEELMEGVSGDVQTEEEAEKTLLERLFRRGHWGPFEHPHFTLAVEGLSRSAMAQITRHRHITFDVQSQRYVDFSTKDEPIKAPKSLTDEEHFARETGVVDLEEEMQYLQDLFAGAAKNSVEIYQELIESGVPKEDARFILPIGTKVNLTMTMNARTVLHIQNMRNAADAQWEARELSQKLFEEFEEWMPYTTRLYEQHGPQSLSP